MVQDKIVLSVYTKTRAPHSTTTKRYIQEFFRIHAREKQYAQRSDLPIHLIFGQAERAGNKLGVAARERLSTSTRANQNLTAGKALLGSKILDKVHKVSTEALDLFLSDEAEHVHLAVLAIVQFPAVTCKGDGSDRPASSGDGASATKGSKPDHDLVFFAAGGRARGEEVVGYVRNDVVAGVGPLPD